MILEMILKINSIQKNQEIPFTTIFHKKNIVFFVVNNKGNPFIPAIKIGRIASDL